jgi:hypothetical protein
MPVARTGKAITRGVRTQVQAQRNRNVVQCGRRFSGESDEGLGGVNIGGHE